jgi:hypothetical protein
LRQGQEVGQWHGALASASQPLGPLAQFVKHQNRRARPLCVWDEFTIHPRVSVSGMRNERESVFVDELVEDPSFAVDKLCPEFDRMSRE